MQLTSLTLYEYEPLKKDGKGKKETLFELFNKKEEQEGVWFWNVFAKKKKKIWEERDSLLLSWIGDTGLAWRSVNKIKTRIESHHREKSKKGERWGGHWQERDREEH